MLLRRRERGGGNNDCQFFVCFLQVLISFFVCVTVSRPTSADQSSLDRGERSPSRTDENDVRGGRVKGDSEEGKVDVVVGDLIDISSDPGE